LTSLLGIAIAAIEDASSQILILMTFQRVLRSRRRIFSMEPEIGTQRDAAPTPASIVLAPTKKKITQIETKSDLSHYNYQYFEIVQNQEEKLAHFKCLL
jgi:hypothetical protein